MVTHSIFKHCRTHNARLGDTGWQSTTTLHAKHGGTPVQVITHSQDMVPDRSSPKVDVEVRKAVLDAHQAVLLHLRSLRHHLIRHVLWPQGRHPADLFHHPGWVNQLWQPRKTTTTKTVNLERWQQQKQSTLTHSVCRHLGLFHFLQCLIIVCVCSCSHKKRGQCQCENQCQRQSYCISL